eukprot:945242-Alexandrium_andersonii.AAC.1
MGLTSSAPGARAIGRQPTAWGNSGSPSNLSGPALDTLGAGGAAARARREHQDEEKALGGGG